MRVNEIFYSLQGEGLHTGTPAVFLRLSGCNLKCPFCDTQHEEFTEMTEQEIVEQVSAFPARVVVVTGGEPLLQLTASLTQLLHSAGFAIHIETNGSRKLPEGAELDWITCSPKEGGAVIIQRIDELKVVFMGQDMSQYDSLNATEYRLQPLDSGNEQQNRLNVESTIDYILKHPKWKLSLQTHKILNVR
ncbi:MAG: 7-carboxy-7-deazaguanine synthase QueE [Bacteroidaceae bacterium]|nr:7-carboxy-7-deazaguanine synthase QueE [Bacteroidaceae bacterium]